MYGVSCTFIPLLCSAYTVFDLIVNPVPAGRDFILPDDTVPVDLDARHDEDAFLAAVAGAACLAGANVANGVAFVARRGDVRVVRRVAASRKRGFVAVFETVLRSRNSILLC